MDERQNGTSRRRFLGVVATALGSTAGCAEISHLLGEPRARARTNLSWRAFEPYVKGQPTLDAVPAADGWLATDPDWIERNVKWPNLTGHEQNSMRQLQQRFEPGEYFFTAIVGALPFDYALGKYRDVRIDGQAIHVYAKGASTSPDGNSDPDPSEPESIYDYTFTLWKLRDNLSAPTDIDFNFRRGELPTDTWSNR